MMRTAIRIIRPVFASAVAEAMMLPTPCGARCTRPDPSDQPSPAASSRPVRSSGSAAGTTTRCTSAASTHRSCGALRVVVRHVANAALMVAMTSRTQTPIAMNVVVPRVLAPSQTRTAGLRRAAAPSVGS